MPLRYKRRRKEPREERKRRRYLAIALLLFFFSIPLFLLFLKNSAQVAVVSRTVLQWVIPQQHDDRIIQPEILPPMDTIRTGVEIIETQQEIETISAKLEHANEQAMAEGPIEMGDGKSSVELGDGKTIIEDGYDGKEVIDPSLEDDIGWISPPESLIDFQDSLWGQPPGVSLGFGGAAASPSGGSIGGNPSPNPPPPAAQVETAVSSGPSLPEFAPVPEPSIGMSIAFGLVALFAVRRIRK